MKRELERDGEDRGAGFGGGRGGGGGGGGQKRFRSQDAHQNELRIMVPSRHAGGVIGKGGENIRRLRTEYDAAVNVPDSNSPERILTITTDNPENMLACLEDVMPKLEDTRDRRGGRGDDDDNEDSASKQSDLRIMVHQSHAGAIIGRAGFKIKELREQSGATLKVFTQCCPMSTERVVMLTGTKDCIVAAVKAVRELLADIPVKGGNQPYDPINCDPSYASEYGGLAEGGRGGGGRGGRGGEFQGPPRGGGGFGGRGGGMGGGRDGGRGGRFGGGYGDDRGGYDAPMRGGGGAWGGGGDMGYDSFDGPGAGYGGGGGRGGGGGSVPSFGPPGGPVSTTQVTIPNELGGTVIGRGGERINTIRQDSGAQIQIDPTANEQNERIITISGTNSQIQMAQYLLQQCVRASAAGRRYIEQQQHS